MEGGDFGGEGGGASTRYSVVIGGGTVVGGGGVGWIDGGSLCCIDKFILKSIKSLKDFRKDSSVFLINKFVSMRSTRNYFSIVSSRLAY